MLVRSEGRLTREPKEASLVHGCSAPPPDAGCNASTAAGNEKLKPQKARNLSTNQNDTRGMLEHGFDTVANIRISRVLQRSRGYEKIEWATISKP